MAVEPPHERPPAICVAGIRCNTHSNIHTILGSEIQVVTLTFSIEQSWVRHYYSSYYPYHRKLVWSDSRACAHYLKYPQAMHTMLRPGLVILKEHRHKSTLTFVQVVIQSACSVSQKLCCKINSNFLPRARGQVAGGLAGRLVNCI